MKSKTGNLLITGPPGVGKTTLIRELCDALRPACPAGFYTQEIRRQGVRTGFELISLDGRRGVLAHVDTAGPARVGRYGVDVVGFERFLETIDFFAKRHQLVIVDEIGKMECFSAEFRALLGKLLDSEKPVVATIALKGGGIIEQTKRRSDVTLFNITRRNRERLLSELLAALQN
jgi:nucleoside-triphosphatase